MEADDGVQTSSTYLVVFTVPMFLTAFEENIESQLLTPAGKYAVFGVGVLFLTSQGTAVTDVALTPAYYSHPGEVAFQPPTSYSIAPEVEGIPFRTIYGRATVSAAPPHTYGLHSLSQTHE